MLYVLLLYFCVQSVALGYFRQELIVSRIAESPFLSLLTVRTFCSAVKHPVRAAAAAIVYELPPPSFFLFSFFFFSSRFVIPELFVPLSTKMKQRADGKKKKKPEEPEEIICLLLSLKTH